MTLVVYGIKNCDTVKKARRWLDEHSVQYRFHDFRQDGLDEATVARWLAQEDWSTVLNRRSTSWKSLAPEARESMNKQSAQRAILDMPTLVKRPVLEGIAESTADGAAKGAADYLIFGFSQKDYEAKLLS